MGCLLNRRGLRRRPGFRSSNPQGVEGNRRFFHSTIVLLALAVAVYAVVLPARQGLLVTGEGRDDSWSAQLGVALAEPTASSPAAANIDNATAPSAREREPAAEAAPLATPTRVPPSEAVRQELGDLVRILALGVPPLLSPSPNRLCEPSSHASYCIYTVREGDTLSLIAALFDLDEGEVPGWELLVASNKPDLTSAEDFIQPGQKLRIPTRLGVVHTVILGESVGELAEAFDVTSASIIAANGISNGDLIRIGDVLLIPNPRQIPQPQFEMEEEQPAPDPEPEPLPEPEPEAAPVPAPAPQETVNRHPVSGFIWPLTTRIRITSYFGPSHPLGIDMGLSHDPRASIHAAGPGRVTFAGGDPCCSYGLYVIVDHGNGFKTLYAHFRSINVRVGQQVEQGQVLGIAGSTGYSTGVHLHFEVHLNGKRVNPLNYLP